MHSTSQSALLLIDVINDFDFSGNEGILEYAKTAASNIQQLKKKAKAARLPCIYVNDNFGKWRSDFRAQIQHCLKAESVAHEIVSMLTPDEDDYFVLKPKHSGFYSTNLDVLLEHLQVQHLFLVGFAGNICVLFTANDAYMRGYSLAVPEDCIASNSYEDHCFAVKQLRDVLKADTRPALQQEMQVKQPE